jgi:hypothetical protein
MVDSQKLSDRMQIRIRIKGNIKENGTGMSDETNLRIAS